MHRPLFSAAHLLLTWTKLDGKWISGSQDGVTNRKTSYEQQNKCEINQLESR